MLRFLILALVIITACGGSLSEEQRQKIKDEMNRSKIRKITDAELTEAGFKKGRSLMALLDRNRMDPGKADSIASQHNVAARWIMASGKDDLRGIERDLFEAYEDTPPGGTFDDNLQRIGTDSLLYTKPVLREHPDGTTEMVGMWSVWIAKKQLVLEMN